jgi:hypothetical protein
MVALGIGDPGIELRVTAYGARTSRGLTPPPKIIGFLFLNSEYKYLLT